jgi:hypothetical protein
MKHHLKNSTKTIKYTVLEYDKVFEAIKSFRLEVANSIQAYENHKKCIKNLKKLFNQVHQIERRLEKSGRKVSLSPVQKSLINYVLEKK